MESHPDVDLLAAFSERTLANPERALVLGHLSRCAECREVVALAIPVLAPINMEIRTARSWRPVLAWSGLAACAVIAAGALLVSRGNHGSQIQLAKNQVILAPQRDSTSSASAVQPVSAIPEKPKASNQAKAATLSSPASLPRSKDVAGRVQSESPTPSAMANLAGNRASGQDTEMKESFAASVPASPGMAGKIRVDDRYPHWMLNPDGTLLRSLNAGSSWQKVEVPGNTAELRAIATIGPEIWVAGNGGAVYHSTDTGLHWKQVSPSSGGKALTDDVISIEFASAQQGKLITRQRETWTTSDGGATWNQQ